MKRLVGIVIVLLLVSPLSLLNVDSEVNSDGVDDGLEGPDDKLQFILFGDTHYGESSHIRADQRWAIREFINQTKNNENFTSLDFFIHGGDLVHESINESKWDDYYFDIKNRVDVPIFELVGNHDYYGSEDYAHNETWQEWRTHENMTTTSCWAFSWGDVLFIGLGHGTGDHATLPEKGMRFTERMLNKYPDMTTIITTHESPQHIVNVWNTHTYDDAWNEYFRLHNEEWIEEISQKNPQIALWMSQHQHATQKNYLAYIPREVPTLINGMAGGCWWNASWKSYTQSRSNRMDVYQVNEYPVVNITSANMEVGWWNATSENWNQFDSTNRTKNYTDYLKDGETSFDGSGYNWYAEQHEIHDGRDEDIVTKYTKYEELDFYAAEDHGLPNGDLENFITYNYNTSDQTDGLEGFDGDIGAYPILSGAETEDFNYSRSENGQNWSWRFDGVDDNIKTPVIYGSEQRNWSLSTTFKAGTDLGALIDNYYNGQGIKYDANVDVVWHNPTVTFNLYTDEGTQSQETPTDSDCIGVDYNKTHRVTLVQNISDPGGLGKGRMRGYVDGKLIVNVSIDGNHSEKLSSKGFYFGSRFPGDDKYLRTSVYDVMFFDAYLNHNNVSDINNGTIDGNKLVSWYKAENRSLEDYQGSNDISAGDVNCWWDAQTDDYTTPIPHGFSQGYGYELGSSSETYHYEIGTGWVVEENTLYQTWQNEHVRVNNSILEIVDDSASNYVNVSYAKGEKDAGRSVSVHAPKTPLNFTYSFDFKADSISKFGLYQNNTSYLESYTNGTHFFYNSTSPESYDSTAWHNVEYTIDPINDSMMINLDGNYKNCTLDNDIPEWGIDDGDNGRNNIYWYFRTNKSGVSRYYVDNFTHPQISVSVNTDYSQQVNSGTFRVGMGMSGEDNQPAESRLLYPGRDYVLSFRVRGNTTENDVMDIRLENRKFFKGDQWVWSGVNYFDYVHESFYFKDMNVTDQWVEHELVFTASDYGWARPVWWVNNTAQRFYIDNISISTTGGLYPLNSTLDLKSWNGSYQNYDLGNFSSTTTKNYSVDYYGPSVRCSDSIDGSGSILVNLKTSDFSYYITSQVDAEEDSDTPIDDTPLSGGGSGGSGSTDSEYPILFTSLLFIILLFFVLGAVFFVQRRGGQTSTR